MLQWPDQSPDVGPIKVQMSTRLKCTGGTLKRAVHGLNELKQRCGAKDSCATMWGSKKEQVTSTSYYCATESRGF